MSIPRVRTLPQAIESLRAEDPASSFGLRALKRCCANGDIPVIRVASRVLVNMDDVYAYLRAPAAHEANSDKIRRIG